MKRMKMPDKSQPISAPGDLTSDSPAPLLEAIIQFSEDAIITKNLDGIVTSWNPAATRIFGYLPEEIVGQSILKIIPPHLHHEEPVILGKLKAGEPIAHFETERLRKDGRLIFVSLTISPVRDKQGKVIGVSKIARDISAERQMDIARVRLAAIVESADDAIVSKNLNGIITSWNHGAEVIFGYTEKEMIGASILVLVPEELHPEEQMILEKVGRGEPIRHYETVRRTKDGRHLDVSLTISPLRDSSGKVVGASKVLRDISQRKRMEQSLIQAEKLTASGKMAASIAHEINNPLEAVLNLIYLAQTNSFNPEVKAYLNTAESELVRLSHIAKQTLGFYREQKAPAVVSLDEVVNDVLKIYTPKLIEQNVVVEANYASTRQIVVMRGEMVQVISNHITNAAYAMPSGGRLCIAVEEGERAGREGLVLSIADSGNGIPEENLQRVFEPFFTTRGAIGTGIGLWVAKQFIEGHLGKIDVESSTDEIKHGTKIRIWLPFENPYARELRKQG
ncbi:MAG: PAS domain S-box protein [Acidobacteriaceae bacterium]